MPQITSQQDFSFEQQERMEAEAIAAKVKAGEHVRITEIAKAAIQHPDLFREIPDQREAVTVGEKLLRGEHVPIKKVVSVAQRYPEVIRQVAVVKQQQKTVETRTSKVMAKVEKGEKLRITEYVFLAQHYPEEVEEIHVAAGRIRESKRFYTGLGYPQYGGKYSPFKVPEDYTVKTIKETPEGLQVSFGETRKGLAERMMEVEGTPVASRMGLPPSTRDPTKFASWLVTKQPVKTKPLAPFAGMVASGESIVYTVGRLAGLKTPRLPPTFIGLRHREAVGYGSEYAAGTIMGDVFMGYAMGKGVSKLASPITSRISTRASSWLTSKYVEKPLAWKGAWKEKAVMRLTGAKPHLAYGEVSIPTPEVLIGGGKVAPKLTESALKAQDIGWELTISPRMSGVMITKVPTTSAVARGTLPLMFGLGQELIPFSKIQAQSAHEQLGFEGRQPAKTFKHEQIEKVGGFQKTRWTMGTEGKLGFTKPQLPPTTPLELAREMKLLPLVTQTHVTRMGIYPFTAAPHVFTVGAKGTSLMMGMGLPILGAIRRAEEKQIVKPQQKKTVFDLAYTPKEFSPVIEKQRSKISPVAPQIPRAYETERVKPKSEETLIPQFHRGIIESPVQQQRHKPTLLPQLSTAQTQIVQQKALQQQTQKVEQATKQALKQTQIQQMATPSPPSLFTPRFADTPRFPSYDMPRKKKRRKRMAVPFGYGWVFRKWPILGPEEVIQYKEKRKRKK